MTIELYQKVHPRVCGEYLLLTGKVAVWKGSPPRMRGILATIPKICVLARFTPAYAGNINNARYVNSLLEVHPRVCGEYSWYIFLSASRVGSPPRMRGICTCTIDIPIPPRFTPAYAGNIQTNGLSRIRQKVHPRVCGEYVAEIFDEFWGSGSPPRMRGISL